MPRSPPPSAASCPCDPASTASPRPHGPGRTGPSRFRMSGHFLGDISPISATMWSLCLADTACLPFPGRPPAGSGRSVTTRCLPERPGRRHLQVGDDAGSRAGHTGRIRASQPCRYVPDRTVPVRRSGPFRGGKRAYRMEWSLFRALPIRDWPAASRCGMATSRPWRGRAMRARVRGSFLMAAITGDAETAMPLPGLPAGWRRKVKGAAAGCAAERSMCL